jgi:PTS system nitrogen regulatory IIA component
MKLTIHDAAELLGVAEKTIYHWIQAKGLPAYKMNEEVRFNRSELLEWATMEGVGVAPGLFQDSGSFEMPKPAISEALARGGVHAGVPGTSPEATLRSVVRLLPLPREVDRDFLLAVLLAREALGSTAIGDGIAIPHVRNPIVLEVEEPIVSLWYLDAPVDFGALDGQPVRALFTLVTTTVRTHLHLLSRLSHLLRNDGFRGAVKAQAAGDGILGLAREIEAALPARRARR